MAIVCVCVCVCVCVLAQPAILGGSVILGAIDFDMATRFVRVLTTEWLVKRGLFSLTGTVPRVGDLLYRGSVDGMTAWAFHERCDGKGPTLTLIRADEGGRVCVFGGYTSASWESDGGYGACSDAFVFSVTGPHCSVTRFRLRSEMSLAATRCTKSCGPSFGCHDIVVTGHAGALDGTSNCRWFGDAKSGAYVDEVGLGPKTFTGAEEFTPVDIEVYAVV